MKRAPQCVICALAGIIAGALAFFLIFGMDRKPDVDADGEGIVSNQMLTDLAFEVAGYIKAGDFDSLSEMVHPIYGLVISPYATVNLSSNQCFTADAVADFDDNDQVYTWGTTSDSRAPIDLTVKDYFSRYVFNCDYTQAPTIGINQILRTGNSLENVTAIFPGAQFVDLCNPGTESAEYQDWSTLRLVFEYYNDELMLTAIIHSEYTI